MIDVFILRINTSLKVLFKVSIFRLFNLFAFLDSFNLSNNITVSYSEYPRIVSKAIIVEGVISKFNTK